MPLVKSAPLTIPRNILDVDTAHRMANTPLDQTITGVWGVKVTVADLRNLIDDIGPSREARSASRARMSTHEAQPMADPDTA